MGERLGKVADLALARDVTFLADKSHVVAKADEPSEYGFCFYMASRQRLGFGIRSLGGTCGWSEKLAIQTSVAKSPQITAGTTFRKGVF